jgi:hypothetical protein
MVYSLYLDSLETTASFGLVGEDKIRRALYGHVWLYNRLYNYTDSGLVLYLYVVITATLGRVHVRTAIYIGA